jgi:enediyne polyketide synthase
VHFSGVFSWSAAAAAGPGALAERRALPSARELLYGGVCFHGPRFQQLGEVLSLSAIECQVTTGGRDEASLYGAFLPPEHAGGSPLLRDSVMHALQLCVPHQIVLPVGVAQVSLGRLDPRQAYLIAARQCSSDGHRFVFDIDVVDQRGVAVERWRGLELMCAPPASAVERRLPLAPVLLEAIAGRIAMDELDAGPVRVRLYTGLARHAASAAARTELAADARAGRRHASSATHFDEFALVLASDAERVTIDVQLDPRYGLDRWRLMLGEARWQFSARLAQLHGLAPDAAALCTWALSECLVKLGLDGWPLASADSTRRPTAAIGDMLRFRCAEVSCAVMLVHLEGKEAMAAMALAFAPSVEQPGTVTVQAPAIEENA